MADVASCIFLRAKRYFGARHLSRLLKKLL